MESDPRSGIPRLLVLGAGPAQLGLLEAARARGLAVGEAPIPTHYGDEISHLNVLTYGLRVLRVLWRYGRGHYA